MTIRRRALLLDERLDRIQLQRKPIITPNSLLEVCRSLNCTLLVIEIAS
jgi:hypothetical protein